MYGTIQKWGNSQAIRLPKAILEMAKLNENDKVEIKVQDGNLIISPVKNTKPYKKELLNITVIISVVNGILESQ